MKRLLLFVHYDRDGKLDDHVLYLLNALRPFCTHSVVIANSPLNDTDMERLSPVADRVIRRENCGFDFGAWGDVLPEYEAALENEFDSLLLVNGTCFGPLFPLDDVFEKMENTPCNFWGITGHPQINGVPAHLQSYFMEIRKPMVTSRVFRQFFRETGAKCVTFEAAVRHGEIGFSQEMQKAGFRYQTYIHTDDPRQAPNAGIMEPFSRNCADDLIRNNRLPLLKVKAFSQVTGSPIFRGNDIFRALRESGSTYPEKMIIDFLRRTAPLSWQKNLPDTLIPVDRTEEPPSALPEMKIAIFYHCFLPENAEKVKTVLANMPVDFDLLVTSPEKQTEENIRLVADAFPHCRKVRFVCTPNRGRDVAPWLCAFPPELHLEYDAVLKLHVKSSPQMPEAFTRAWQEYMVDNLAGSPALIGKILQAFAEDPVLGTVFPPYPPIVTLQCPQAYAGHPDDAAAGQQILKELKLNPPQETGLPVFSPGTMFWYRPEAIRNLLEKNWTPEDFPAEPLPWRGTAAHAMERIIPYIMQANGFYFRQSIHRDRLEDAFRTYENRILYHAPSLKQSAKIFRDAIKRSLTYRIKRK